MNAGDKVIWLRNSRIRKNTRAFIPAEVVRVTAKQVTIYVETASYIGNLSVPKDRVKPVE